MDLYVATWVSVVNPQFDPAWAFMTLRALEDRSSLDTIAGVRAEGEASAQRDTQEFMGSVQRSHRVTNSHLRMDSELVAVGSELSRWISGKQWPVACPLPISPKRSIVGLPSPRPPRCWEQRPATRNCRRRTSCKGRRWGSPTQSVWRGLGRWRIPVRPTPAHGGKASDAADKGTRPCCRGGKPQATSPTCVGVGSSGWSRWGGGEKRDLYRYGYGSALFSHCLLG